MNTWASKTREYLESIGIVFTKLNQGGREWWECHFDGNILASNKSLGTCIRIAADSLGGL